MNQPKQGVSRQWRTVASSIITGKELDNHTCGELEDTIWKRLEFMDEILDERFSCEFRHSGVGQGEMHDSGLRLRITLETTATPLDEAEALKE